MKNRIIAIISSLAIFASATLPAIAGSSGVAGGAGPSGLSPVGTGAMSGNGSAISYGTLGVANGGTGRATLTSNSLLIGNGTSQVSMLGIGTALQQVRVNAGGTALEYFTPTTYAATGANSDITSANSMTSASSLATVGTITSGTWNGTAIGTSYGGTGLSTLGTASQQIRVNSGGTALEWFTPTAGAAAGANTDITSLALTGPTTAIMASDACPLTLRGAPLINGGANGQTKHLLEFRRGQDNLLLGYAGAHDYDSSGDMFYYITMGTQNMTVYNTAYVGKGVVITPAQNGGESGPLLSLYHQATPTKDFINAGVGIDESDVRFKVDKDGAVTAKSAITATSGDIKATNGDLVCDTNGKGVKLKRGATLLDSGTNEATLTGTLKVTGDLLADTVVKTPSLSIPSGSNKKIGSGTLSSGTCTVSNTSVTANSIIFVTPTSTNANAGVLAVTAKTAATSFVVTSSNGSDDNTFDYVIIESP